MLNHRTLAPIPQRRRRQTLINFFKNHPTVTKNISSSIGVFFICMTFIGVSIILQGAYGFSVREPALSGPLTGKRAIKMVGEIHYMKWLHIGIGAAIIAVVIICGFAVSSIIRARTKSLHKAELEKIKAFKRQSLQLRIQPPDHTHEKLTAQLNDGFGAPWPYFVLLLAFITYLGLVAWDFSNVQHGKCPLLKYLATNDVCTDAPVVNEATHTFRNDLYVATLIATSVLVLLVAIYFIGNLYIQIRDSYRKEVGYTPPEDSKREEKFFDNLNYLPTGGFFAVLASQSILDQELKNETRSIT